MAPPRLALRHAMEGTSEPLAGLVISVVLAMLSIATLSGFITQRYLTIWKTRSRLALVQWLVFSIYIDSALFVLATAILQFGFGVSSSGASCETAILLCLICYVTTKLIYMFLVEKAHIIRASNKKPRLRSKLYLFNSFGMIGAYCVVVVPNFILRIARVDSGECIIGMQRPAMIPLIVFDLLVNIYLTIIFLKPLSGLYSYKNVQHAPGSRRLRTMAMRTFVGCVCTLISSIVNLSVLVGLNGEPGWVCLMCCNSDILFSAIVIQWVTSKDDAPSSDDSSPASGPRSRSADELNGLPPRTAHHRSLTSRFTDNIPGGPSSPCRSKSHLTLTTEEAVIVEHAAKMSLANSEPTDECGDTSPSCTSGNTFREGKRRQSALSSTEAGEGHVEEEGHEMPRLPPPPSPSFPQPPPPLSIHTGLGSRHPASEVRVDVDYGASLSEQGEEGDVKMGNTVVVVGSPTAGRRKGRSAPWRYQDGRV